MSSALDRLESLELTFSALAHEQRRHILLTLLYRGGELSAGDIAARFSCSWPTTTRHLKVLQEAGLITVERVGRERRYRLERERLFSVAGEWIANFA